MQRLMDRLDALLTRRRRAVLVAWVVLLVAAAPFALRQTEYLTSGGFTVPGSGSEAVDEALHDFEGATSEPLAVVIALRGGDAADVRREIAEVERAASRLDHVELDPRAAATAGESAGQRPITIVPLALEGSSSELSDVAVDMRDELGVGEGARGGVEPYLVGQQALWAGMQDLSKEDLEAAETTGLPIVLLILLAVFGSLAAASLPLTLGLASVVVTGAGIFFLSQAMGMSVFVTNVASMIGIGVAVDYSLFVLARYREEVAAGEPADEARRVALRTSGVAVAFSGLTVMVSLAGLFLVQSQTIRSMALGAIVVVAVSVLAALTLLPVLMRTLGRRAHARGRFMTIFHLIARSRGRRRAGSTRPDAPRRDFWRAWVDRVTRRPVLAAGISAAALLVVAIPTLSLEFGDGALRQFPDENPTRVGAELAAAELGPGAAGPTHVVARFHDGVATDRANEAAVATYAREIGRDPEVAQVAPPVAARDGRSALLSVQPRHDPESQPARDLVDRLRAGGDGGTAIARAAEVEVGGATAHVEDFKDLVAGSMWKILLFVMALSYVVLLVLLRSAILPLKAIVMNLLSVGAAYGVLVAVFQWGWIDGFLGFESLGYINTMTPPLLLAIVFGLSMDYEVFLLSRIRERYDATGDTNTAVAQGLRASARTITSAALIMVAVFAVFASTGVPSIKEIGVGLAVAIAIDATIVRLVLVPATMELLGRWNWWLPRPLARVLPRMDFESSGRAGEALA